VRSAADQLAWADAFQVDGARFRWGTTLQQALDTLAVLGIARLPPTEDQRNVRVPCTAVAGLAVVECWLLAPRPHKPVLEVGYELAVPVGMTTPSLAPWLGVLKQIFGEPNDLRFYDSALGQLGSIVEAALWLFEAGEVRLSVYGATRTPERGLVLAAPAAAALTMSWRDWRVSAHPFVQLAAALEARLDRVQDAIELHTRATLAQWEFALHSGLADDERRARRALDHDELCDTPTRLRGLLGECDVALWRVPNDDTWAVSNYAETVLLRATGDITLDPFSGPGVESLSLDDLELYAPRGDTALARFAEQVALATGRPLVHVPDWGR